MQSASAVLDLGELELIKSIFMSQAVIRQYSAEYIKEIVYIYMYIYILYIYMYIYIYIQVLFGQKGVESISTLLSLPLLTYLLHQLAT